MLNADQLIDAIDIIAAPRIVPRLTTDPPGQPTVKCRVTRPRIVVGHVGMPVFEGDIVSLTAAEVESAKFDGYIQQLEQFPNADNPYHSFYAEPL